MRRADDGPKWGRLLTFIATTAFAVALLFYWLEH
jgi:hypothetical protein